jgi:hypothetical protein
MKLNGPWGMRKNRGELWSCPVLPSRRILRPWCYEEEPSRARWSCRVEDKELRVWGGGGGTKFTSQRSRRGSCSEHTHTFRGSNQGTQCTSHTAREEPSEAREVRGNSVHSSHGLPAGTETVWVTHIEVGYVGGVCLGVGKINPRLSIPQILEARLGRIKLFPKYNSIPE